MKNIIKALVVSLMLMMLFAYATLGFMASLSDQYENKLGGWSILPLVVGWVGIYIASPLIGGWIVALKKNIYLKDVVLLGSLLAFISLIIRMTKMESVMDSKQIIVIVLSLVLVLASSLIGGLMSGGIKGFHWQ
ncbi:MAG: hypothetical protein HC904_06080 [Blastochloris sp.]|nr:hypothetical protein [Blastochloris sp.]